MDKELIINILNKANFTDEFIENMHHNFPEDYEMKFINPYEKDYSENPILTLSREGRLFETLAQLLTLQKVYQDKGIPNHYLYKSIYDLNYRLERYYKNNGVYGLTESDIRWLTPLFQAKIFDIGVLRFEMAGFSYAEIERSAHEYMPLAKKWKEKFPEGTPVVNIHILKDADFRPEKVDESFQQARPFFENYYPEHAYEYYVCRTWLLYEPLQELLGEKSNITSFSKRFKVIAENQNNKQALERMYGTSNLEEIKQMDKTSSLTKTAYKNLDKIGEAAGIIKKEDA